MRILIGYDGSESGDAALEDLKRAGLPRDSEVMVIAVGDLLMSNPPLSEVAAEALTSRRITAALRQAERYSEQVVKEAEGFAAKGAEKLRLNFPEWKIETNVITGTPAWELIDAANHWNADLVVVGSHGRSAIGRLFLGSVSKRIATDAHCSVRVTHGAVKTHENGHPPRIIVGVDGSPAAEEAIYAVGQRVWQHGTEICLVAVDDGTPPTRIAARLPQAAQMINSYFQTREERVSSMLEWATEELNNIGLKTSVLREKGDPQNILIAKARELNANAIFVGTRDFKSGFERFRLGSVSTAIVTNAPCSVEIVRPSAEGTQHESK